MIDLLRCAKYRQMLLLLLCLPSFLFGQGEDPIKPAAERPGAYLPLLYAKNVAVVANQTAQVQEQHLVDFLLAQDVQIAKVFAPEHGFRGQAAAGEKVKDGRDPQTGLPIVSLYGNNRKPSEEQLRGIDIILFDIQDVGARFYTYGSTLTYVMEQAARFGIKVIVLDRPNPHGNYVDGPVLEPGLRSFVGLHPMPIVHGLTMGEFAKMVNGEGWLADGLQCDLEVIRCANYRHDRSYSLPVAPSPNLPNDLAVRLYPSLCLFEGTNVSIGRGTDYPFQVLGAPYFQEGSFNFTPRSLPAAPKPKYEGEICQGFDLRPFAEYYLDGLGALYLQWLIEAYAVAPHKDAFFNSFFDKLAGTRTLRQQIKEGWSTEKIRASWEPALGNYKRLREDYLLYP